MLVSSHCSPGVTRWLMLLLRGMLIRLVKQSNGLCTLNQGEAGGQGAVNLQESGRGCGWS
jgi:hypothetical protein